MTQPNEQPVTADAPATAAVPVDAPAPAEVPTPAAAPVAPAEVPAPVTVPTEDEATLHVSACQMCGQHDDHPKHVFVLNPVTGEETRRHMDCCAAVGCQVCALTIKDAGGVTGHELRSHIVAQANA